MSLITVITNHQFNHHHRSEDARLIHVCELLVLFIPCGLLFLVPLVTCILLILLFINSLFYTSVKMYEFVQPLVANGISVYLHSLNQ